MIRIKISALSLLVPGLLLAACSSSPPKPATPDHDIVAAIHAAGRKDNSALHVTPLRDPGVKQWIQQALSAEKAGHYVQAASKLDQAMAKAPKAPDILQDRAEIAVRLKHYQRAEQLARRSWNNGPKLGPLCARNWQTILEIRRLYHDAAGARQAQSRRDACQVKGVTRM